MLISCGVFSLQRSFMLVFLPPLRLWVPHACIAFFCVSISPFPLPLLLPLPPLHGINLFSFPSCRSPPPHPVFSFSLWSSSHVLSQYQTSFPTSSIYSVFNLPLCLTASSTCVNISARCPPVCPSGNVVGGVCQRSVSRWRSSVSRVFGAFAMTN